MNRKKFTITLFGCLLFLLIFTLNDHKSETKNPTRDEILQTCNRIVSIAPSITEVLFSVGLGENIVGVTSFATYPDAVKSIPKVGGYFTPEYEKIVSLQPDVVVMLEEHGDIATKITSLNIPVLQVNHKTLNELLLSMVKIGNRCGKIVEANQVASSIRKQLSDIHEKTKKAAKKSVLISVSRKMGVNRIGDVYAAGSNTFYDNILTLLNVNNAYRDATVSYPKLHVEGVVSLNPDIVIDIVAGNKDAASDEVLKRDWNTLPMLQAVKDKNVFVFREDYTVIPGSRILLLVQKLARVIHPEIFREFQEHGE